MFGIGNTIGAGIFNSTGVAAQYAGIINLLNNFRSITLSLLYFQWFDIYDISINLL